MMQAEEIFGISVIGTMVVSKGSDLQERRSLETNKQTKQANKTKKRLRQPPKFDFIHTLLLYFLFPLANRQRRSIVFHDFTLPQGTPGCQWPEAGEEKATEQQ